jgi:hypothetical protein
VREITFHGRIAELRFVVQQRDDHIVRAPGA